MDSIDHEKVDEKLQEVLTQATPAAGANRAERRRMAKLAKTKRYVTKRKARAIRIAKAKGLVV